MSHAIPHVLNFPPTPDSCLGIAHTPSTATHRSQVHVISLLHGNQATWLQFSNIDIYRQKHKCKEIRVWMTQRANAPEEPAACARTIPGHRSSADEFLGPSTHHYWTVRNKVPRCTMTLTRRKKREYNNFSYSLMFSKSCSTGLSNFSMILREKIVQEQGNGSSAEPAWKTARQQGEALLSSASKPQFPPGKKDKARRSFPDTSCSDLQVTGPVCFQLCLEKGKWAPKLATLLLVPPWCTHTRHGYPAPLPLFLTFLRLNPKIPPTSTDALRSACVHINESFSVQGPTTPALQQQLACTESSFFLPK